MIARMEPGITPTEPSCSELLAGLERWTTARGFEYGQPWRKRGWALERRDDHVRIHPGSTVESYVKLSPWQACLWALLVEHLDTAPELARMLLDITPGWRSRSVITRQSLAAVRERMLRDVQPRGEWRFSVVSDPERTLHGDGFRHTLKWYEDNPEPEARAELLRILNRWVLEAMVLDDWRQAGSPGVCPVPEPILGCPELGQWLLDELHGRPPEQGRTRRVLDEVIAAAQRHAKVEVWASAIEPIAERATQASAIEPFAERATQARPQPWFEFARSWLRSRWHGR